MRISEIVVQMKEVVLITASVPILSQQKIFNNDVFIQYTSVHQIINTYNKRTQNF